MYSTALQGKSKIYHAQGGQISCIYTYTYVQLITQYAMYQPMYKPEEPSYRLVRGLIQGPIQEPTVFQNICTFDILEIYLKNKAIIKIFMGIMAIFFFLEDEISCCNVTHCTFSGRITLYQISFHWYPMVCLHNSVQNPNATF